MINLDTEPPMKISDGSFKPVFTAADRHNNDRRSFEKNGIVFHMAYVQTKLKDDTNTFWKLPEIV